MDDNMPESVTDAKGRAKEAAGNLTNDDGLKHEGKAEQAGEKAKSAIDDVVGRVKGMFGRK